LKLRVIGGVEAAGGRRRRRRRRRRSRISRGRGMGRWSRGTACIRFTI
jgi:hypothetical protein